MTKMRSKLLETVPAAIFLIAAIFLASACVGLRVNEISVKPKMPEIQDLGAGKKLFLGEFKDARAGNETGTLVTCFQDPDARTCEHCDGSKKEFIKFYLEGRQEPSKLIQRQVGKLLQDAGFSMQEGKAPGDAYQVTGKLKDFNLDYKFEFANICAVTADVEFEVSLLRGGKSLLQRSLHGSQTRKTQNFNAAQPFETVAREALEIALDKTADFLESEQFLAALGSSRVEKGADEASIDEKIEKLVRLKKSGSLTEDEFRKAKSKLLEP